MKTNMRKQQGATFVSWVMGAAVLIFLGITGIKMVPVYLQYQTIKTMVNELAKNPETKRANKRVIRAALAKRLDINALDKYISPKDFDIKRIKGSKNRKEITIQYEVRKPWFANMDFIATFNYSKEIGAD